MNAFRNLIKGMSEQEVVMIILCSVIIALFVVVLAVGLVSLLPVSDNTKYIALFGLGITIICIGYFVLIRIPQ